MRPVSNLSQMRKLTLNVSLSLLFKAKRLSCHYFTLDIFIVIVIIIFI